ncbi:MAG: DUF72 domain-containing protein [Promethearchaeota archaeon]
MQTKILIGCAGWDYNDWVGPFYPKNMERFHHLEYYTKYFDIVEINSTFYNLPSEEMVINWVERVPKSFRYIVKVWQKISHNLNDPELESHIAQFYSRMAFLKEKISKFLIQFPPWFKYSEKHFKQLSTLLKQIPLEYNYVIELRDNSWFDAEVISKIIDRSRIILGTTYIPGVTPYYMPNQRKYYIRLIGDRELNVFNRIQRKQEDAINDLTQKIQNLTQSPEIYEIFIIVNNHFAGFAPESANELKKRFNIPIKRFNQQKKISEFF